MVVHGSMYCLINNPYFHKGNIIDILRTVIISNFLKIVWGLNFHQQEIKNIFFMWQL